GRRRARTSREMVPREDGQRHARADPAGAAAEVSGAVGGLRLERGAGDYCFFGLHFSQRPPALRASTQQGCSHSLPAASAFSQQVAAFAGLHLKQVRPFSAAALQQGCSHAFFSAAAFSQQVFGGSGGGGAPTFTATFGCAFLNSATAASLTAVCQR